MDIGFHNWSSLYESYFWLLQQSHNLLRTLILLVYYHICGYTVKKVVHLPAVLSHTWMGSEQLLPLKYVVVCQYKSSCNIVLLWCSLSVPFCIVFSINLTPFCCRFVRQIIQSLPPILEMLSLLLFFMLLFSMLGQYIVLFSMCGQYIVIFSMLGQYIVIFSMCGQYVVIFSMCGQYWIIIVRKLFSLN